MSEKKFCTCYGAYDPKCVEHSVRCPLCGSDDPASLIGPCAEYKAKGQPGHVFHWPTTTDGQRTGMRYTAPPKLNDILREQSKAKPAAAPVEPSGAEHDYMQQLLVSVMGRLRHDGKDPQGVMLVVLDPTGLAYAPLITSHPEIIDYLPSLLEMIAGQLRKKSVQ